MNTDLPSFLVFSNKKAAIIDWELSIYKGSFYFDNLEIYSLYVGVGNITMFAGYNVEKEIYGVFADAYLLNIGYDGKYIDASIDFVGWGYFFYFDKGKLQVKVDPMLLPGFTVSIDFGQIIKDIFGWEW